MKRNSLSRENCFEWRSYVIYDVYCLSISIYDWFIPWHLYFGNQSESIFSIFRFTSRKNYLTILTMSLIGLKMDTSFVLTNWPVVLRVNLVCCKFSQILCFLFHITQLLQKHIWVCLVLSKQAFSGYFSTFSSSVVSLILF